MRKLAQIVLILAASCAFAAPPAPTPVVIDSQTATAPALSAFQAEAKTFRVMFRDGNVASDASSAPVFMWWAADAQSDAFVTATWSRVNGGTTGAVDFTFSAAAVNTNGDFVYGVGAGATYRQGTLHITPNPYATGAAAPTFSTNVNLAGVTFLNYQWPDAVTYTEGSTNGAALVGNTIHVSFSTNYAAGGSSTSGVYEIESTNARVTVASGTGPTVRIGFDATGLATGDFVRTETDSASIAQVGTASNALRVGIGLGSSNLTAFGLAYSNAAAAQANSNAAFAVQISSLPTGTPVYVETDTTALAQLATASNSLRLGVGLGGSNLTAFGLAYTNAQAVQAGTNAYFASAIGALGVGVTNAATVASGAQSLAESVSGRVTTIEGAYITSVIASNSFVETEGNQRINGTLYVTSATYAVRIQTDSVYLLGNPSSGSYPAIIETVGSGGIGPTNPSISIFRSSTSAVYITASRTATNIFGPLARASYTGSPSSSTNTVDLWDGDNLPSPRDLSLGTNAPSAWTDQPSLANLSNAQAVAGVNITNLALGLASTGVSSTNAQTTALGAYALATNAHLLAGVANTNALGAYALATNAVLWNAANSQAQLFASGLVHSNAVIRDLYLGLLYTNLQTLLYSTATNAGLAQAGVSNIAAGGWSQFATGGSLYAATNILRDVSAMHLTATAGASATNPFSIVRITSQPYYVDSTGTNRMIPHAGNLSSVGIQTAAGFNSAITNFLTWYSIVPTSPSAYGVKGYARLDSTNLYLHDGLTWHRINTVTNW